MIQRTFQDIPEDELSKENDNYAFLSLSLKEGTKWDDLLQSKRVILISEAGSGKTFECQSQSQRLYDQGKVSFSIELATLANNRLEDLLEPEEQKRFEDWLSSQSDEATFFLDSYDELKLTKASFRQALNRFKKGIKDQLHRVRIIITSRPIPFDEKLIRQILPVPSSSNSPTEETFANIAIGNHKVEKKADIDWRSVALDPLSDKQILEFATEQGIDEPQELLEDLERRNATQFARRPQDLIELCADWHEHKRIRFHNEQVKSNIRLKLQPRDDRPELAEISIDKAIEGASRLALAMLVTRKLTIRHSAAADDIDSVAAFDPSIILSDWQADEIKTLLERPLFGFASYGRVRFHHRSVLEYLASENLKNLLQQRGMSFKALRRLLFANTKDKIIVRPTMRPVAAWLALKDNRIFEILRNIEPGVLLNEGDPEALTPVQRNQLLNAYVSRFKDGGWRGLSIPNIQVHRFASPDLSDEITRLWKSDIENFEVRELLLSLIDAGNITECIDIAFAVAIDTEASMSERLIAIQALASMNDARLTDISAELCCNRDLWPADIVPRILIRLFPSHISIEQLCSCLSWIEEKRDSFSSFIWQISSLISEANFDLKSLETLRDNLIALLSEGITWGEFWRPFNSHRAHLSEILISVCVKGLSFDISDGWLQASVLSLHFKGDEYNSDKIDKVLKDKLATLNADETRRLFWVEDSLLQTYKTTNDPWNRYYRSIEKGVVNLVFDRDLPWILKALSDENLNYDDREFLLETTFRISYGQESWIEIATELKTYVSKYPSLLSKIHNWMQPRTIQKWEKKRDQRRKQEKRRKLKSKASWILFVRELKNKSEELFSPEHRKNTAWNLWRVIKKLETDGEEKGWNRDFFEAQFGEELTDKIRSMLMEVWRLEIPTPTLPSERPVSERNRFSRLWIMGLFAVYAETEDPDWVKSLSADEAILAARYSIMGYQIPIWLEQLIVVHPESVNNTIANELSWELHQADLDYSSLLQDISYASKPIQTAFYPILCDWLSSCTSITKDKENISWWKDRLKFVIDILLKSEDQGVQAHVLNISQECLQIDQPDEIRFSWLKAQMSLSPDAGIETLDEQIKTVEPGFLSEVVKCFSELFGDHHNFIPLTNFTPQQLLHLLRLAYHHIQKEDDIERESGVTYSPGDRDYAERVRSSILEALLNSKGEDAWQAKQEFAEDPLIAHMKDRILSIADENWAKEIDSETFDDDQAISLDKTGEAPASTNSAMFAILNDRLSDLDELLLSDTSPREMWASIDAERVMRKAIARELNISSNKLYTVDQEAVTADEKETDIRLRSVASGHQAVIELKLADNRSARDLIETIPNQLVKKYMAAEDSKSGCLLVTIATDRQWEEPDTKELINLDQLRVLLEQKAREIEENMGRTISLVVKILDLKPRLTKE